MSNLKLPQKYSEYIANTDKPSLYHYTSMNALTSIFQYGLWASKSDFLNDESELIYVSSVLSSVLDRYENDLPIGVIFKEFLKRHSFALDNIFIVSLTENPDSITLWSNYAVNEGCNIGFNVNLLNFTLNKNDSLSYVHGKVIYDRETQAKIIDEEYQAFAAWWAGIDKADRTRQRFISAATDFILSTTLYGCFFKDPCFSHEEEYRVVVSPKNVKDSVEFRHHHGAIMPYVPIPLNLPDNLREASVINEIRIGPRVKSDVVKSGLEYFLYMKGCSTVSVETSKIPLRF